MNKRLTDKQTGVALDMIFSDGDRSAVDILSEHSVSTAEYSDWLADADYRSFLSSLSDKAAAAERPRVIRRLYELSAAGDTRAIKLLLDMAPHESCQLTITPREDIEALKADIWGGGDYDE